ncbi:sugar phosphate isomerase/epimerase family protein [Spongiimicrobium sp. 3-5]|uniref:sugar phosphate isomerase/epimerase family protein n=1 Tax=Spongiimicrobium sp. 3-5 TaxID=3332596 RepID=UPI003980A027
MKRRNFIRKSSSYGLAITLLGTYACKETKKKEMEEEGSAEMSGELAEPFFKLSLAQWSIHNMIREDGVDPYTFAELAKNWGFTGLEYVSQLYKEELEAADYSKEAMDAFVAKCNAESGKHGLENLIIMIDGQGDLATADAAQRKSAVENHYKWVDAAQAMGCHSIRVNLSGSTEPDEWTASSIDGLTQLATYAKDKNINVIVENHGGLSSNAEMLANVMVKVAMENCGTLPDFGNFCIRKEEDQCVEQYDIYKGVKELMPHAKAVSAKSHDFDADGNETVIDYVQMLQIVKDAGYTGHIGVEYEGSQLGEEAGIIATKELMINAAKKVI